MKKKKSHKMKVVSFQAPDEMDERIGKLARKNERTRSDIIRRLITAGFENIGSVSFVG